MPKITIDLVRVTIRRDANTITTVDVPPYELSVIKQMFGKEHVTVMDGAQAGAVELDPDEEFKRLCSKYGKEKTTRVFGDDDGERLAEVVARAGVPKPAESAERATLTLKKGRDGPAPAL
jgi:hypothetical protein